MTKTSLLESWVEYCLELSYQPAELYAGSRKILRNRTWSIPSLGPDLQISDCGYTPSKMTALRRDYIHKQSRETALMLWKKRRENKGYGSVGFHCYNHLIKVHSGEKAHSRSSVHGPCIQAVTFTLLKKEQVTIDVFYRTTDIFKKFAADLILLRDDLLPGFDLRNLRDIRFHFANVSVHPMYFATIVPSLADPVREIEKVKEHDPHFHQLICNNCVHYFCPDISRGMTTWSSWERAYKHVIKAIDKDVLEDLAEYLRSNWKVKQRKTTVLAQQRRQVDGRGRIEAHS